eukprot:CAMPEP_0178451912 /NCGR_PEP_ID=MMETSP0689_2-20121128/43949_1 /TAXON_ID=160604 /ORGANISM="Amphidinium massartii, Strain CS-259" /LENGTH=234 /DNA_ID=CAMNT_0020077553 /DNA_START=63 /DNA_END=764 /DNA_ORIENTATION=+
MVRGDRDETSSRSSDEEERSQLQDQILHAQRKAGSKLLQTAAHAEAGCDTGNITPQDLYGNWTDSFGNTVCVYSCDAFTTRLVATLSKPPRRDINLPLTPLGDGEGWLCGRGVMDFSRTSIQDGKLCWAFPDGKCSMWTKFSQPQHAGPAMMNAVPMLPLTAIPAHALPAMAFAPGSSEGASGRADDSSPASTASPTPSAAWPDSGHFVPVQSPVAYSGPGGQAPPYYVLMPMP